MLSILVLMETTALFGAIYAGLLLQGGTLEHALILTFCSVTACYYNDLYDFRQVRRFSDFLARAPRTIAYGLILLAASWALFPDARLPAESLAFGSIVLVAVLVSSRATGYAVLRLRPFRERVLILGTGSMARLVGEEIESRPHLRFDVIQFEDDAMAALAESSEQVLPRQASRLDRILAECSPHRIIVTSMDRLREIPVRKLVELRLSGIAVEDGRGFLERVTGKVILESLSPGNFCLGAGQGWARLHLAIGRAASLAISASGLVLVAPLFALIALAIRLDSPGPIFYIQDRIGLHGRRFRMLKFRTMRAVASESSAWAGDNGYRITRVGTWLRKFRLDELPQFVNILLGDMNLVGPRPHPVSNYALFAANIPQYDLRHAVRPGVTGWAQTRYFYANNLVQEMEKVRYDLYYVKHMSAWLDLRILFDTVKIVLLGRRSDALTPLFDPAREGHSPQVHDRAA